MHWRKSNPKHALQMNFSRGHAGTTQIHSALVHILDRKSTKVLIFQCKISFKPHCTQPVNVPFVRGYQLVSLFWGGVHFCFNILAQQKLVKACMIVLCDADTLQWTHTGESGSHPEYKANLEVISRFQVKVARRQSTFWDATIGSDVDHVVLADLDTRHFQRTTKSFLLLSGVLLSHGRVPFLSTCAQRSNGRNGFLPCIHAFWRKNPLVSLPVAKRLNSGLHTQKSCQLIFHCTH